jgi:hypothetical protein
MSAEDEHGVEDGEKGVRMPVHGALPCDPQTERQEEKQQNEGQDIF